MLTTEEQRNVVVYDIVIYLLLYSVKTVDVQAIFFHDSVHICLIPLRYVSWLLEWRLSLVDVCPEKSTFKSLGWLKVDTLGH